MKNVTIPNLKLSAEWGPEDPEVESVWILLKDAADKIEDAK